MHITKVPQTASEREQNLIWIDLEMTGLDPARDRILEIATVVTDKDLNILAEGKVLAVHQSEEVLQGMNDWCKVTHSQNGLLERVRASNLTERAVELQTLDFLKQWTNKNTSPICGNSIAQDKRFLYAYMPELADYFHYRHIDVSTLKELARRWKPEILTGFKKKNTHLALDDIRESIAELTYYREHFLNLAKA